MKKKKTKKERIEELEKRIEQLEEKLSKRVATSQQANNISATEGISGAFSYAIDSAQKQAPEFWYVDIQKEKDSELLPKFKEWFNKVTGGGFEFIFPLYGYSGWNSNNGYDCHGYCWGANSDKMQKITLNEWNHWFNK